MENVCSGRKSSEISRAESHPHAIDSTGLFCPAAGSWEESTGECNCPAIPQLYLSAYLQSVGSGSGLSQRGRMWSNIWWFLQEKHKCRRSDLFALDKWSLSSTADAHWDATRYPTNTLYSCTCQQANWQQRTMTKQPVLNMLQAYIGSELH